MLAGIAPDLDGLGIVPELLTRNGPHPLLWWSEYHHLLAHNLPFAGVAALAAAIASRASRGTTALLAFLAVHLHLLGDLVGSRGPDGYQWPIPYLYPFSRSPELSWGLQWKLNAWPNVLITLVLMAVCFVLAWRRGYSPIGLVSSRADGAFVGALRGRFPRASANRGNA